MAIGTNWKIEIGTVASPTDFTSRVTSAFINQQVDVNVIGRGTCVITLLNKDGALTPGGGGTYSNTDWFAQGVFVSALTKVVGTADPEVSSPVFHGVVTDFDLIDDGVYSTVTITAQDGLSVGGRSPIAFTQAVIGTNTYASTLDNNIYAGYDILGASFPLYPTLGEPTSIGDASFIERTNSFTSQGLSLNTSGTTYADLWQTNIIPTANDVCYATTIERITSPLTATRYNVISIPYVTTRNAANTVDFTFVQTASGTNLPFDIDTFQQAFNKDTLINRAIIGRQTPSASSYTATASNYQAYATRQVQYTDTFLQNDGIQFIAAADRLVNRYSTPRFNPESLGVTARLIRNRASDFAIDKWRSLLDIRTGIWQKLTVTWTGSGASSQTADCVIKGRQINVTPDNAIVTLTLGNWVDNHGFILDTDKLNTDRLG